MTCDELKGRLRAICRGEANVSANDRRRLIEQWIAEGKLSADPDEAKDEPIVAGFHRPPCVYRGDLLRTETCNLCGRKNEPAPVYSCSKHGECTEKNYGIKNDSWLLPKCLTCRDYDDGTRLNLRWSTNGIVPLRPRTGDRPWEGSATVKPWDYRVQVVIAHLDTPNLLDVAIPLWRLQTVRPFVTIIDTGSTADNVAKLLKHEADDVEVHLLRSRGVRHSSSLVSMALDVALAVGHQECQFHTHTDVFPRRRDLLESLVAQCDAETPVVGYEISPRSHVNGALSGLWRGMVGHTCTMLHVPTIRSRGISWSLERGFDELGIDREPHGNTDTEVPFNLLLRKAGIRPKLIGHDKNGVRQVTPDFDHFRSFTGAQLYSPGYYRQCQRWSEQAIAEGKQRIEDWTAESKSS